LAEHGVNQRGLAMVHVGDDGDVADTWVQIENSSGSHIGDLLLLYYASEVRSC
jgi:hypothetical protein